MVLLAALIQVYIILIIARALMSWFFRDDDNALARFLVQLTDPFLKPIRKLLDIILPLDGIDLSPVAAVIILEVIKSLL